jgi:hypothetical protein
MVRMKRARDAQGKETVFHVRNHTVDWNDIKRYIRSRQHLVAKINATNCEEIEVGNSRFGIVARTPSPDPAIEFSVPFVFNACDDINLPEQVLRLTTQAIDGAVEMQTKRWIQRYLEGDDPILALFGDPDVRWTSVWFTKFQLAADSA